MSQFRSLNFKWEFMHNNTFSDVAKLTRKFFEHKRFTREKIMKSPDLNLIENLWSIVKIKLYEGYKQYNSKTSMWRAIKITMSEIESA